MRTALRSVDMSTETPKRLTPEPEVVRRLYLVSGNLCAYAGCKQPLMGSDGTLVGEVAHICAALPAGRRFDPTMTNEQRRSFDNLVLLCANHHTMIDKPQSQHAVSDLQDMKQSHERVYTGIVDQLLEQVRDITATTTWIPPVNLEKMLGVSSDGDERAADIQVLDQLAVALASIPLSARSVLAIIVGRGERCSFGNREVGIPMSVLEGIVDCTDSELKRNIEVLEYAKYAWVDEEFYGDGTRWECNVGRSTGDIGWDFFGELNGLAREDATVVERVLIDLDFSALDEH